ncbi:Protegrin-2 [Tupaia chinensis]|uniref:Protegrin-2 n=1 Tax=Tupaia chinensis TaxID=246437 RepID=L8Y632_TUPCH|nr:Protegrin-2 [Tupaia chinensis]
METQKASLSLGLWSLLLLGLVMPPASGQTLSYREAVLRAVDNYNQQSSEANLYRLLDLDQPPTEDEDPDTPKPVSFTVKETVCAKTTRRPPEQCDFKKNGLEKQCMGIVILDQAGGSSDISCTAVSGSSGLQGPTGWSVDHPRGPGPLPNRAEKAPPPWAPPSTPAPSPGPAAIPPSLPRTVVLRVVLPWVLARNADFQAPLRAARAEAGVGQGFALSQALGWF